MSSKPQQAVPTTKLKLTQIGSSVGVILPKAMLEHMRVGKGDFLQVLEIPDGYQVQPFDAEFAKQMAVAEKVMREDRDILRRLAE